MADLDAFDDAGGPGDLDDVTPVAGAPRTRRSRAGLIGLVVALVAVAGVGAVLVSREEGPPPKPDIPLDAWAPYWALNDALEDFDRRVGSMRDVSPFWFSAAGVDEIAIDPNALDDRRDDFVRIARRSNVNIVPSINDLLPAGEMAAIIADPDTRTRHVEAIRRFVVDGEYDGVDIDYEQFAFADGRDTWATTRPNWVAFITELGAVLHANSRTLTVSIPPVYDAGRTADSGFWVYDYGAIAPHVDRIRIMAYDFSVGEPGPIAPLAFVERAIDGAIEATGDPSKLVLGLPAYGRNWPTSTVGTCPEAELQGRTSVTARSVDELVALRGATPIRIDDTGEWMFDYDLEVTDGVDTCTQTRRVQYVDGDGIRLRMDLARERQLNGVSLWALGFEDADVWDAILPTVTDQAATTTAPGADD